MLPEIILELSKADAVAILADPNSMSPEEAEMMAKDAIEGCLEVLKDLKQEIPFESDKFIVAKIPAEVSC